GGWRKIGRTLTATRSPSSSSRPSASCYESSAIPAKVSGQTLSLFVRFARFESEALDRTARCGLGTLWDFRFVRLYWEIQSNSSNWRTFFGGGKFSPYYDDFRLVVNWATSGQELKAFVASRVGSASRKVQGEEFYFRPGFTFPR